MTTRLRPYRTHVLAVDETAHFSIRLLMHDGAGYEPVWNRNGNGDRIVHRGTLTHSLAVAKAEYHEMLRKLQTIEAALALGLEPPFWHAPSATFRLGN